MIPIGKAMAEALLESDESTGGSMEIDYFEGTQLIPPVKYPNPNTSAFIGKALAEALLESDESTASLSDGSMEVDYFEDTQQMPSVKYPNSNTSAFILPNPLSIPLRDFRAITQNEIRRQPIPRLPLTSIQDNHSSFSECRYVALDCESKCQLACRCHFKTCGLNGMQWLVLVQVGRDPFWHGYRLSTISDSVCSIDL